MALTKITSRILDSSGVTILGTIATGVWQGTAINQTYLVGQSGTNTGDETLARINALDVTELGTVSSGVWNGTAIASAYLDADTAHLSTTQTFTGAKTFSSAVLIQQSGSTGFVTEKTGGTGSFINLKDNAGTVFIGGVNNEFVVQTSGSSYSNKLTISNAGNATFSGKIIALNWIQGVSLTNVLYSSNSLGTYLQSPGATANNNNSKIFFRNSAGAVKQTFDTQSGAATFAGNLVIGTAGKGIDFTAENTGRQSGADRTGSILDDYEEGTWDPTPGRTGNPQPNVSTYAYREGTYVKVGKLVTVMWDFAATITSQGSTAAISIKGLPFPVGTSIANGGKMAGYSVVQFRSGSLYVNTTAQRSLTGFTQQGATYIYVESQKMGTDGFASAGSVNNYLLNVSSARSTGTCTYFTNQ